MGSEVPLGSLFAVGKESRFLVAKRSDIGRADMKIFRFADSQKSRFLGWKRSYMFSAFLLCGQFADVQEFCF